MPDKYNITKLITVHKNEISAALTFSDAAMNTDLKKGHVVFQTIKDHWRLSIRHVSTGGQYYLVFHLNYPKLGRQFFGCGAVQWSINVRDLETGLLTKESMKGCVNFTFEPPHVGVLCSFKTGSLPDCNIAYATEKCYMILLKLTITIPDFLPPPLETSRKIHINTMNILNSASFKIPRLLLDPTSGDVVFIAKDADDIPRKLYAYRSILAGNSEYFANRLKPEWTRKQTIVDSPRVDNNDSIGYMGSRSEGQKFSPSSDEKADHRQVISMEDPEDDIDFVTLHNILYFIYIGCVNLPLPKRDNHDKPLPEGYPDEAEPFLLFRNAKKLLLPCLTELCLFNIEHDISATNVAERLFHSDCEYHEELRELYFNYLVANYDKVKETEGWERAICTLDDASPSTVSYRARVLFDISKRVRM